jgi:TRAP-type C4-dicarboxylate transport system permease small subunit
MRCLKLIALTSAGLFFLWFGIELLRLAYKLNNPFDFLLSFFAANLVILISAALTLGFILHLWRECRKGSTRTQVRSGSRREDDSENCNEK